MNFLPVKFFFQIAGTVRTTDPWVTSPTLAPSPHGLPFGLLYTMRLAFSSRTKCIYGLVELLCERDDVISLAFQNAQDMKDGAMDHPPWERPTDSNVPQQP